MVAHLLAGFGKRSLRSTEAAVKYLVLSSVSGVCFLYAAGILFSVTHSLNIYEIHKALVVDSASAHADADRLHALCDFAGISGRGFPSFFVGPRCDRGSSDADRRILVRGIPATGFAVAIRLFLATFTQASEIHGQWKILGEFQWTEVLTLLSGLTMLFGALLSLRQTSAKTHGGVPRRCSDGLSI